MFSVLLLEDEPDIRRCFKKLLSGNHFISRVIDTSSGTEAICLVEKHKPDAAFLNIKLAPEERLSGIAVAKKMLELNPDMFFVFITEYPQYAIDSFVVHPYDYILKPVKKIRIEETINNLAQEVKKKNIAIKNLQKINIKTKEGIYIIRLDDIIFIEKQNRLNIIHTRTNIYEVHQTLRALMEKLGPNFLRVHQSFIANINRISNIRETSKRSYEIEFKDYDKVALMSRYKFKEHKHIFTDF